MTANAAMARAFASAVLIAISISSCSTVPEGYHWPQHSTVGSGAASGIEGVLSEVLGCIYVTRETDEPHLVIWPPFARLTLVDGEPVVAIGGVGFSMGETIHLGGGEMTDPSDLADSVPNIGELPCAGPYWIASGLAD